jgi:hypothetical protein
MKLQPNFSWQKYEGEEEDKQHQFQFQLQRQHTLVSNAINTTIDDLSYWNREKQTSFTWIDLRPIYTKSIATGPLPIVGSITVATGISGAFTVISIEACVSDGSSAASNTLPLPYLDVAVGANSVGIVRNGTDIVITTGGTDRSAYSGYITLNYVKG